MESAPGPRCLLHPDAEVRPSAIAGTGLAARAPIGAGTVVARLGGRLVPDRELRELLDAARRSGGPYVDTIAVTRTVHLVLPPRGEQAVGFSNHSCDPTLWWDGPYTLLARRDIHTGEELTSDYATSTWDPAFVLDCACGAPECRGTVTGDDWRLPGLQARYGRHWVPGVLALIDAAR
ncbi:SET domain-containing protein-lysine N-methyltransferase [Streptomyces sp. WAC 06738]|uniref:SET domain-containing protein n=1 Tax=Streptomyces sp. WAC 06738 TaxID=2203210 RepID=UPI0013E04E76|nr:SET domain-containing protein-lysine N-methyltransferase [Streptomyces sp. WAC 06738]